MLTVHEGQCVAQQKMYLSTKMLDTSSVLLLGSMLPMMAAGTKPGFRVQGSGFMN